MDPISIALSLAQFAPSLLRFFGVGEKPVAVAEKAIEIAKAVTGAPTSEAAIAALQANAQLAQQFQLAVLAADTELEKLAVKNAEDVNKTMQAEAASEHWPTYAWRPAIGFAVALNVVGCTITVLAAYILAFATGKADHLAQLPSMLAAMAGLVAVVSPILGIASWFRGKMQATK